MKLTTFEAGELKIARDHFLKQAEDMQAKGHGGSAFDLSNFALLAGSLSRDLRAAVAHLEASR